MKNHTKQNHEENCVVCGARRRNFASQTCDAICHRAKLGHRTRGQQIKVELRAAIMRPWGDDIDPVTPFGYDPSNGYNQPSAATI